MADPAKLADELDFIAVHVYPDANDLAKANKILREFHIKDKPLLIEELFPIKAHTPELSAFLSENAKLIAGCISFYWGRTPQELAESRDVTDVVLRTWLPEFARINPNRRR